MYIILFTILQVYNVCIQLFTYVYICLYLYTGDYILRWIERTFGA